MTTAEPLQEYKSSEEDGEFQEDCTPQEKWYPQRERGQKQFTDMVQYMVTVRDSEKSEQMSLKKLWRATVLKTGKGQFKTS
jgi:hypothetical protein